MFKVGDSVICSKYGRGKVILIDDEEGKFIYPVWCDYNHHHFCYTKQGKNGMIYLTKFVLINTRYNKIKEKYEVI
jgi:hypothetical protein